MLFCLKKKIQVNTQRIGCENYDRAHFQSQQQDDYHSTPDSHGPRPREPRLIGNYHPHRLGKYVLRLSHTHF